MSPALTVGMMFTLALTAKQGGMGLFLIESSELLSDFLL